MNEAIKYTTQGDLACSWCGYLIPNKYNKKRDSYDLQDWISAEVAGMFCSRSHAESAGKNMNYRAKFAHKVTA